LRTASEERTGAKQATGAAGSSIAAVSFRSTHLLESLKIARDCGYGLYHIDLLLERARLHLLRGNARAALDDIEVALDTGIPANEETGQVELLAANDEQCGYAWAIPAGLQLRAEALLLQATQLIGSNQWKPCLECGVILEDQYKDRSTCHDCQSSRGKLSDLDVAIRAGGDNPKRIREWKRIRHHLRERYGHDGEDSDLWERFTDQLEAEFSLMAKDYLRLRLSDLERFLQTNDAKALDSVRGIDERIRVRAAVVDEASVLIDQARQLLNAALDCWHDLRDPEPTEDNNFVHPGTGEEYNYRAAETYQVLIQLERGTLTDYPLVRDTVDPKGQEENAELNDPRTSSNHLAKARNWLQARFLERSQERNIVDVYTEDGRREPTDDERFRALVPQQEFHDYLLSIDAAVTSITRECERLGWIAATQRHQVVGDRKTVPVGPRYYSVSAQVTYPTESSGTPTFDTFLSHNSKDKPEVKRLGEALKKRGMTVWLDEWELRPGLSWQDALEEIITNCKSAAVCVGSNGIGPWEDSEMKALLRRFVNEKRTGNIRPVIPVLLPGAPDDVNLPLFLEEFTWVDLREGLKKDGLERLEWGITGVKPNT
jgi:hypothetical protein